MRADGGKRLRDLPAPDLWPEIERRMVTVDAAPRRRPGRLVASVAAIAAMIALTGWGLFSLRDLGDGGTTRNPGGPLEGTGLVSQIRIVDDERVPVLLAREGIYENSFLPIRGGRSALIRLDWTPTTALPPGAKYQVVVIDRASGRAADQLWDWPHTTLGWSGQLDDAATRYPWLAPAAPVCDDSGCTDTAMAAVVDPRAAGPLWIVARWPEAGGNGLRPGYVEPDPFVGVIATDADGDVLWAAPIPVGSTDATAVCPPVNDLVAGGGDASAASAYAVAVDLIDHQRPGSYDPRAAWDLLDPWYAERMGWASADDFARSDEGGPRRRGAISKVARLVTDVARLGDLSTTEYTDFLLARAGMRLASCPEATRSALARSIWVVTSSWPHSVSVGYVFVVHRTYGFSVIGSP
jgi:hypothetical protein